MPLRSATECAGMASTELLDLGAVQLELSCAGSGPAVLLLPSLGRGAGDFDLLSAALAGAGFHAIALNPRGIGASRGPMQGVTLHDLAADAAAVIRARAGGAAHVVGHAFGHRIACCLAVDHPRCVRRLVLLGAGGRVEAEREAREAFKRFLTESLSSAERAAAVKAANFAAGSDPSPWLEGWWTATAVAQIEAAKRTPHEEWWASGSAEILVVQGLEDRMAPPENGRALARTLGRRVRLVEVRQAGHALLPEQPARVSAAVLAFLAEGAAPRA
jgi:pimeloyl-ACP methyl ester carboxylesterase